MSSTDARRGAGDRLLAAALTAVAVAALTSVVVIDAVHLADRYEVTHVSGAWMALAKYVNSGILYPPLYDGHAYGGTRYMPLQILINAAAAHATGEYLVSAKVVAYVLFALLLGVVYTILRRQSEIVAPVALASIAALLVGNALRFGATSIGADTLAATFQLVAAALVCRSAARVTTITAGLLCVLAFLTKVNGVWGPVAIALWLAGRDRRRLGLFVASFLLPLALSLGGFEVATAGRFFANVFGLGPATLLPLRDAIVEAPRKFYAFLVESGLPIAIIFPFAVLGIRAAVAERRVTPYHVGFVSALLILLFTLADRGTAYNQFIDVDVLTVVVAADFVWSRPRRDRATTVVRFAFGAALICGIGAACVLKLGGEFSDALRTISGRPHATYPANPVGGYVTRSDRLLSQDPYVPVSLGELPVVLDAYAFRRVALLHPRWAQELVRRLDAQEFDKIVMFRHVGPHGELDPCDPYWETNHFGADVVAAMVGSYRPLAEANGYWIYVRRRQKRGPRSERRSSPRFGWCTGSVGSLRTKPSSLFR